MLARDFLEAKERPVGVHAVGSFVQHSSHHDSRHLPLGCLVVPGVVPIEEKGMTVVRGRVQASPFGMAGHVMPVLPAGSQASIELPTPHEVRDNLMREHHRH